MLGYVLGKTIPSAEDHLILIEAIIIVLSLIPVVIEVVRSRPGAGEDGRQRLNQTPRRSVCGS